VKPVTPTPVTKVQPAPTTKVEDGARGERKVITVYNGGRPEVVEYWVMPNGEIRYSPDDPTPVTPRIQPRPQQNPQPATPSKERDL
jgi:hypothetical protein